MNDRIKEAFRQVHAEDSLKSSTKAFLAQKTHGYRNAPRRSLYVFTSACAGLLFLVLVGYWLYFTPTSTISIDINPSLELNVNRFDRIISVKGLNEDGVMLADISDVTFKTYSDGIAKILGQEMVSALLSGDDLLTIAVTGSNEMQSKKIYSEIESSAANRKNTCCYFISPKEAKAARQAGLSCGKYKAFLEIQRLDPSVTPEMLQKMNMREIQDYMDALSSDGTQETKSHHTPNREQKKSDNNHNNRKRNQNGIENRKQHHSGQRYE